MLLLITMKNKKNNGAQSPVPIFTLGEEKPALYAKMVKEKNLNISGKQLSMGLGYAKLIANFKQQ